MIQAEWVRKRFNTPADKNKTKNPGQLSFIGKFSMSTKSSKKIPLRSSDRSH